jgi:hypothetical protein
MHRFNFVLAYDDYMTGRTQRHLYIKIVSGIEIGGLAEKLEQSRQKNKNNYYEWTCNSYLCKSNILWFL